MSSPHVPQSTVCFGEFTAVLEDRELFRNGSKVRLQGQPFEILAVLLEHPGRLVTREELRQRLWPSDTFVDFEHGLNAAVNRLREALGDSPEHPRFIETIPRRGYRFVAPLSGAIAQSATAPAEAVRPATLPIRSGIFANRFARLGSAFTMLGLAAAAVVWWLLQERQPIVLGWTQLAFVGTIPVGPTRGEGTSLVTDGRRIYFVTLNGGPTAKLAYVYGTGGKPVIMSLPFSDVVLRHVSPDGSTLLVWAILPEEQATGAGHLWLVPTAGGGPRRLANIDGDDGAWSPDGQEITFSKDKDLYIATNDGATVRKIATAQGNVFGPRWSPDAKRIRFGLEDSKSGATTLWEYIIGTHDMHRVDLGWEYPTIGLYEFPGNWTPDGRYYVFHTWNDAENENEIWMLRENTLLKRHPFRLLGPAHKTYAVPNVEGERLFVLDSDVRPELIKFDLKTHQAAPCLPGTISGYASKSPDNKWLAFVDGNGGLNGALWRSRPNGSDRLQLSPPGIGVSFFQWSPDSKFIAFQALPSGGPRNVYVVPASGGTPQLMLPKERNVADPEWSPDGQSLMFGRPPANYVEDSTVRGIEVLNLSTHEIKVVPGSEGLFSPRWSPDGRYVAAMTLDTRKLMLFDFDTQKWTELASSTQDYPKGFDTPRWSPDTKYVYVNEYVAGKVVRIVRTSHRIEEVLDTNGLDPNAPGRCNFYSISNDGNLFIGCWLAPSYIHAVDLKLP